MHTIEYTYTRMDKVYVIYSAMYACIQRVSSGTRSRIIYAIWAKHVEFCIIHQSGKFRRMIFENLKNLGV